MIARLADAGAQCDEPIDAVDGSAQCALQHFRGDRFVFDAALRHIERAHAQRRHAHRERLDQRVEAQVFGIGRRPRAGLEVDDDLAGSVQALRSARGRRRSERQVVFASQHEGAVAERRPRPNLSGRSPGALHRREGLGEACEECDAVGGEVGSFAVGRAGKEAAEIVVVGHETLERCVDCVLGLEAPVDGQFDGLVQHRAARSRNRPFEGSIAVGEVAGFAAEDPGQITLGHPQPSAVDVARCADQPGERCFSLGTQVGGEARGVGGAPLGGHANDIERRLLRRQQPRSCLGHACSLLPELPAIRVTSFDPTGTGSSIALVQAGEVDELDIGTRSGGSGESGRESSGSEQQSLGCRCQGDAGATVQQTADAVEAF